MQWYVEDIDADLGCLDMTFEIGDIIAAIENSETENAGSGYFGLRDYVAQLSINLDGVYKGYKTSLKATNSVDFVPATTRDKMTKLVKRQSIINGTVLGTYYFNPES